MLASLALAPLLAPPKALPGEEARLAEGAALDGDALGDGPGRLALVEGAGREAEPAPVDGRAPAPPVEGPAPPELQPRASLLLAEADAEGVPLLLSRPWSGCHFFCPLVDDAVGRVLLTLLFRLTLEFRSMLTFRSMSMFTLP